MGNNFQIYFCKGSDFALFYWCIPVFAFAVLVRVFQAASPRRSCTFALVGVPDNKNGGMSSGFERSLRRGCWRDANSGEKTWTCCSPLAHGGVSDSSLAFRRA